MSLLNRAFENARGAERRFIGNTFGDSSILPNSVAMGLGATGAALTEQGALSISTVLSCARVLVNDMSILPFKAFAGDRHGVKRTIPKQPLIMTEPFGPDLDLLVGMKQLVLSIVLRGRAFLFVETRDKDEFPTQVTPVHPDWVKVRRDPKTGLKRFDIRGYECGPDEVKHIIGGLSLAGSVDGVDPVTYNRVAWGLAADRTAYGAAFFRNGTTPSGVISVPGPGDRKKAREVKESWEAGHSGIVNSHRPAVLFGGATWAALSVSPENAQWLQTGQFMREEICGWFGVPLQRIMAVSKQTSAAAKGTDQVDQGYATHTLLPLALPIERCWDSMLPGGLKSWTQFDFAGLLRADAMERAQIAQVHRLTGVRNRDEIRADEGWAPIGGPDGENYNVPFNTNSAVPPLAEDGSLLPAPATAKSGTTTSAESDGDDHPEGGNP